MVWATLNKSSMTMNVLLIVNLYRLGVSSLPSEISEE